jgi:isopenicillin-N N-acyltransferase-like protein
MSAQPPFIRAFGSHHEIGLTIGRAMADLIHQQVAVYQKLIEQDTTINISWQQAVLQARKYLPFAEEFYPQYIEELYGIAEGSGADFGDVLTLNTMEAITSDALFLKCTSLAVGSEVTESGAGVIVAHNEDWLPDDKPFVYVAQMEPDDEPAFLALAYGALLPNLGFNTSGIAHVADSVYPNDVRLGIPRIIYTRAILGSRTLGQAIQAAIHRRRDAGYNHLIAGEHGEIYCIEASATTYDALYADEHWTAHTNHYTSPMMRPYEEKPEALVHSRVRYNRVRHLVKGRLGKLTVADFQTILADHINYPNGICAHVERCDSPLDCTITIASIIIDMAARTMWVCWGNPCRATYYPYRLAK